MAHYFSKMDFSGSTQNRSWMFDDESLDLCRSVCISGTQRNSRSKACKFASGFHTRLANMEVRGYRQDSKNSHSFSVEEQETLIRFHAHQVQSLCGPNAILPDLRTSEKVSATAVMFLRRFYLSNLISSICPRMMTTACCFLAAKVEEERIDISLLSHATAAVRSLLRTSPFCSDELRGVEVWEIEEGERLLMEGLNYELHCFHAHDPVNNIAPDVTEYFGTLNSRAEGRRSPVGVTEDEQSEQLAIQASDIVRRANIFSDVPFLFAPSHIAFATLAIASGSICRREKLGDDMKKYLMDRFPERSPIQHKSFVGQVNDIIERLMNCPWMDLLREPKENRELVSERAKDLRLALRKAANLRCRKAFRAFQKDRVRKRGARGPIGTCEHMIRPKVARISPISRRYSE